MGIKYLWTVLAPYCDRKPLYELQGKTVAVDLSCWICEAQNIAEYQVQPRMYLRNLYFRTCYLLLMDVNPVFVLEGKAPELKYDTISARNAIQFKGAKPKTDIKNTGRGGDRTRFHFVLKQCEEMLNCLGLACIKGNGEAESMCAYLNEDGLVDGCISQDSDCFAYGAQVVYRNFSISTQGVQAASGGAVDVYDIRKAYNSLSFGRNKLIAMALLMGCDYSDGVLGIGKESVLKFFETVSDDEVLDKLRSWQKNKNIYENYEKQLADKNICISCGHHGKIQGHKKNGCTSCKTITGCDPFKYKCERLKIKNEVNMRNKAIKDPKFPDENIIREFLDRKDNVKELDLRWKQPNIVKFLKFTTKFLQWDELYSFEKILPVLTRWQCRNPELLKYEDKLNGVLRPERIKKVRNPKGVPSYEIIWSDAHGYFKGLVPESQIIERNIELEQLWSTIEPQNLVERAYPQLVDDFKQSKIKPKKVSKRKAKKIGAIDEIADKLDNVSISEPKKKSRKPKTAADGKTVARAMKIRKGKTKIIKNGQTSTESLLNNLDSSLKEQFTTKVPKPVENGVYSEKYIHDSTIITDDRFDAISSTPSKGVRLDMAFDFDMSTFGDESDLELSDIIDDIVSRKEIKDNVNFIANKYSQRLYGFLDYNLDSDKFDDADGIYDERNKNTQPAKDRKNILRPNNDLEENLGPFKCSNGVCLEEHCDNSQNRTDTEEDQRQVSCFFGDNPAAENDLFEKTFNDTFKNFNDSSDSATEEYEFSGPKNNLNISKLSKSPNEPCLNNFCEEGGLNSDDDSFSDNYVPLYERLKSKNTFT